MADEDIAAISEVLHEISSSMRAQCWVAVAVRTRRIASRQFIDCYNPESGQYWLNLPVHSSGGGGIGDFVQTPVRRTRPQSPFADIPDGDPRASESTQVVVLERDGQVPVVIGVVPHLQREVRDETHAALGNEDKIPIPAVHDFAIGKNGCTVILDELGGVTIDVDQEAITHTLRIQFPFDGVMRISRTGKADERLMLSGPLYELLESLNSRINTLEQQMWAAIVDIFKGAAVMNGLHNGAFGEPNSVYTSVTPPAAVTLPAKPTLQAAAINISDDTEAEEL